MFKLTPRAGTGVLAVMAILAVAYASYLAFAYSGQPPLDIHKFRQTQTALTAYWFLQEGFKLAYETPVAGAPWAIPFEFPAYQALVALTTHYSGMSLDTAGRVISYLFLVLCLIPAFSITRALKLPTQVFGAFVAIVFSMPLYVYWGRSFMIETTALFFSLVALDAFLRYTLGRKSWRWAGVFLVFASMAVLQKSTTVLPVLAILPFVWLLHELHHHKRLLAVIRHGQPFKTAFVVLAPLAVGIAWVRYTDKLKALNPLGEQLTSAALSAWNWGTPLQRVSWNLWGEVFWNRMFLQNLGGVLGIVLLLLPFAFKAPARVRAVTGAALVLGLIPLVLFTNLHLVHDYYQTANVIYLAFALAVVLGTWVLPTWGRGAALLCLALVMVSNVYFLQARYVPTIKKVFHQDDRDIAIGRLIQRVVPEGMQFVAFGNDWNSTFAYLSGRKSFTAPEFSKHYETALQRPQNFVEDGKLGAVLACASPRPTMAELADWSTTDRLWKVAPTTHCLVATPERPAPALPVATGACQAYFDSADIIQVDDRKVLSISGWAAAGAEGEAAPAEEVFVSIHPPGQSDTILIRQAMPVPRPDVNAHLKISSDADTGFALILAPDLPAGNYELSLVLGTHGQHGGCGIRKHISIN